MGNSVIYRPAYETEIEYLESEDDSYIDTGLKASSELGILAHIQVLANQRWLFGGANGYGNKAFSFVIYNIPGTSYRYGKEVIDLIGLSLNTTYEFDNTQNHNVMKVGSLTYTATASTFTSDYNFYLFTENRNGTPNDASSGVRIYDFKIYQNSTLVRDFIPVRIGSTGYMYDKVSKQLFANKGTGNFILGNDVVNATIPQQRCVLYFGNQRSVGFERIYEEYKWLIVENSNGDSMMSLPLNTNDFSFKRRILELNGNSYYFLEGQNNALQYFTPGTDILNVIKDRVTTFASIAKVSFGDDIEIKSTNNSLTFNGEAVPIPNSYFTYLRFKKSVGGTIMKISTSSITVDGSVRYVPCRLTHYIPASMDANGIARPSGTCGMWDKVNDVFYGNVADSGSFSVSND